MSAGLTFSSRALQAAASRCARACYESISVLESYLVPSVMTSPLPANFSFLQPPAAELRPAAQPRRVTLRVAAIKRCSFACLPFNLTQPADGIGRRGSFCDPHGLTTHLDILLANMMHLARFSLLFTSLTLGLLSGADPTPPAEGRDDILTPRFVQPSGSPDVCFNNHHCLTYVPPSRLARRKIKPALSLPASKRSTAASSASLCMAVATRKSSITPATVVSGAQAEASLSLTRPSPHAGRSYVFGSPCSGLVECVSTAPSPYRTYSPLSSLTNRLSCVANTTTGLVARGLVQFGFATEPPVRGINPSYLTSESPIVLGKSFGGSELLDPTFKKRLDESRKAFVQWVVWCKAWGR